MADNTLKNERSYDSHAGEWESAMRTNIAHSHLEKPAMRAVLPKDLNGKSILCIGVGGGEELYSLIESGAKDITAIDISSELLKLASVKFPSVHFTKMDMMHLSFLDGSFDLVYSSLAFHYADDWDVLLAGVYRVLKNGGLLVFSMHRPEFWDRKKKTGKVAVNSRGIKLVEHRDILPGNVEIFFYNHADTEAVKESIEHAEFTIGSIVAPSMIQPKDTEAIDREHYDSLNKKNTENPLFLVVSAIK